MKVCTKCKIEKQFSEFQFRKDTNKYRNQCKECRDEQKKKRGRIYREKYSDREAKRHKKYNKLNKDKISEYMHEYYVKNSKKINIRNSKYKSSHRKEINQRLKYKRQTDIKFKILSSLRHRLNMSVINNYKSAPTKELLGCTVEFLKKHLETQFTDNMNWNNYSYYGWHIDHIKPCASFDLSKDLEQRKCFHYTNLQPLWAKDNLEKGAKYVDCTE